jgi:hypothetical protein
MITRKLLLAAAAMLVASPVAAHNVQASPDFAKTKPYGPYEFLIGDWYSNLAAEHAVIHQQFGWGPGKGSIAHATYIDMAGKPEHLHFGGTMIWNGKTHAVDYLFAVEPGSGVEASGTFTAAPDGSITREVAETYPDGKIIRTRQTFHALADGTVKMDLLSQTPKGWVSALPGGAMLMSRTAPQ